jgi:hypothetical protein
MNKLKKICNNLVLCFLFFVSLYVITRVVIKYYNYGLFGKILEGNNNYANEMSEASKPKKFKERQKDLGVEESIINIIDTGGKYLDVKTIITKHLDYMQAYSNKLDAAQGKMIDNLNRNFMIAMIELVQKSNEMLGKELKEIEEEGSFIKDRFEKAEKIFKEHKNSETFIRLKDTLFAKHKRKWDEVAPKLTKEEERELITLFNVIITSGIIQKSIKDVLSFIHEKKSPDTLAADIKSGMNYTLKENGPIDIMLNSLFIHQFIKDVKAR